MNLTMHPSRIFLYICLCFIAGVFISSAYLVSQIFVWLFFVFSAGIISIFWRRNKSAVIVGFLFLSFTAGIFRYQMFDAPKDTLDYYKRTNPKEEYAEANFLENKIGDFKTSLRKSMDSALSPPESSLFGAIMLGETERLSRDLKEKLNRSGTRHITAISGMNIIILANMLIGLGLMLGMWRHHAFYFAVSFIVLFTIMVGAPPSAVRAGIMGGILLFAQKAGRLSQARRLLVLAAAVMLMSNPLLLKFDVGFQLSFLATLGISMTSSWFMDNLKFTPQLFGIRNTISMTVPSVLFTAPILISNFGQLSLVSIFTNILIIPMTSLTLGLGFIASIAGILSETVGRILFWPVWLFLSYSYKVIDISSDMPFAVWEIEAFPWYLGVLYFVSLWLLVKHFKMER
ncbi:MAG: hypothetical protein A3B96_03130 [Candidatus Spechtbacteria bacterium RIFCSPHIGHO2_02_FULL_43_15b]|uniref:ComEC/Rec2-related protein domain-containing protein n=1 Tax=Candidatus Spechtbacteria bacterium RIFCSPHIGHO2_01_FULL_43_30 TaxID=1802158 RepID=A0A1G2H8E3_9BACT|nr:MAG: hypothetical protein A2827_00520 [Candidatus Spechtbacteria bacterium RIFCSPHIGHO2_01_FULL_43_30]OGZ59737.1 MAG: hypothetical protein A3B96_03130 [Candidatus Spechtbacteria bacterium RIFCSPHIGHO2_02_FULL_43_15b]